jgi:hypothetical protein
VLRLWVRISRRWATKDGHPQLAVEPADLRPHARPADRVEPGGGLVEEQDVRVVHQGGRQVEAALHAPRVGGDRTVQGIAHVDQLAELGHPPGHRPLGQPVQHALQPQQLRTRLLRV